MLLSVLAQQKKETIMKSKCLSVATMLLVALNVSAQTYKNGDVGTFGQFESYGYTVSMCTLDATNKAYSIDFTVFEDLTVDRVMLRLIGVDAETTVRIGIMGDDGTGKPNNIYLSSSVVDPANGDSIAYHAFGSVSMSAGSVYHLVLRPETLGAGESFLIYGQSASYTQRIYDRRTDPALGGHNGTSGVWTRSVNNRGFYLFGNGSNVSVSGPSQPYIGQNSSLSACQGANGSSSGQRFTIFEGEVPLGASITFSDITFITSMTAGVTNDLLVELRKDDLTILASAIQPNASITNAHYTFTWDSPVTIYQGVPYLLTFSYIGDRPVSSLMFLNVQNNYGQKDKGVPAAATWGGATDCGIIKSAANGIWSSYTYLDPLGDSADIKFKFSGLVYELPKGTVILIR